MRAGGLEQVHAVGLGLGEGLLMPVHDAVFILMQFAERDEAATLANFRGTGHGVTLRVAEDGRRGFLRENVFLAPGFEVGGGAGVDVRLFIVARLADAQNDADQAVRALVVVALLRGGRDLVIGLRHHVLQLDLRGVVTQGAEWIDAGHAGGCAPVDCVARDAAVQASID